MILKSISASLVGLSIAGLAYSASGNSNVKPAQTERVVSSFYGNEDFSDLNQEVALRYVTTGAGNNAKYAVTERLFGRDRDNDAVGETNAITGSIALDASGNVVPSASGFDVNVTGLTTDQNRRDNYVRSRLLVTDSFPTTKLAVTAVRGLPSPAPTSGRVQFQIVGDLTVKNVTRPTTWTVSANVAGDRLTGTASTAITFEQFRLTKPQVRSVLSVADTIRLEYNFSMQKQTR